MWWLTMADGFAFDDLRAEPVPVERLDAFGPDWQARRRAALAERAAVRAAYEARCRAEAVERNISAARERAAARRASKPSAVVGRLADERSITVPLAAGLSLSLTLPAGDGQLVYYRRCGGDAAAAVTFADERWLIWRWRSGVWCRIRECASADAARALADQEAP
jgi:hypothetical protein